MDLSEDGVSDLCAKELSVEAWDMGVDDCCVVGVSAVFIAYRLGGDKPLVSIVICLAGNVDTVLQLSVSIVEAQTTSGAP